MRRGRLLALLIFAFALPSGFVYAAFAYSTVSVMLYPIPDMSFGPGPMPLDWTVFLVVRAVAGIVLIVSSLMMLRQRKAWGYGCFCSLVLIGAHNIYSILDFVPAAKMVDVSVFRLFPPIMLIGYVLHFAALIALAFQLRSMDRSPLPTE